MRMIVAIDEGVGRAYDELVMGHECSDGMLERRVPPSCLLRTWLRWKVADGRRMMVLVLALHFGLLLLPWCPVIDEGWRYRRRNRRFQRVRLFVVWDWR